ncbi:MAG: class I SAM-dependent methyltransferase [Pseudolabrys sp.]
MSVQSVVAKPALKLANVWAKLFGKDAIWASMAASRISRKVDEAVTGPIEKLLTLTKRSRLPRVMRAREAGHATATDKYWSDHTIRGKAFLSRQQSLDYISELTDGRPFKRELCKLHGPHSGKTILDYGCGPGNDLAGFVESSSAKKIIGVDVSRKALELARARVTWHNPKPGQLAFIQNSDSDIRLPLEGGSIDYIQSLGVIMCATDPPAILREFSRLLRPGGEARIMLYNADSVHVQVSVGYEWRFQSDAMADLDPETAFEKTADLGAPVMKCVRPADVQQWLNDTPPPLEMEFLGGYFMPGERESWERSHQAALADLRVTGRQREFISSITIENGFPYFNGKPAGLGAVYRLVKRA